MENSNKNLIDLIDKFQTYTASLQNDLCSLRDAIEVINSKHTFFSITRLSSELTEYEHDLKLAIENAVNTARGVDMFRGWK